MLKLPFYIDDPLTGALFVLAVSAAFVSLRWLYGKNVWRIGDALGCFFERKFHATPPDKARRVGGHFLLAMAIFFGVLGLFGVLILSGIIVNGDRPNPIPLEEFMRQRSH